jgi:hypothetical protein
LAFPDSSLTLPVAGLIFEVFHAGPAEYDLVIDGRPPAA